MYFWDEKLTEDNEYVIIAKSVNKNYEKIKEEVKKIHSYDVPSILKIDAEANEEFNQWIEKSCIQ